MFMAWLLRIVAVWLAIAASSALAQSGPAPAFTPEQMKAIEQIIRDYIRRNPDVVIDALEAYETKQNAASAEKARAELKARRVEIYDDPTSPTTGSAQADVTIVEFFDYRCPYCKRVAEPLHQLLKDDPKLRLVYKEIPILGPDSVVAARAALAAHRQGKYVEMHNALMRARGTFDEAAVVRIAGELKLDTAKLRQDMGAPEIGRIVERNLQLARSLEISGTPAFVIGDKLVPGAIDLDTMRKLVAEARTN
jgi:protein-disulfide isomerase